MGVLLRDGLIITVVGMAVVFAALSLLWGVMVALQRLLPPGKSPLAGLWRRQGAGETPDHLSGSPPEASSSARISVVQGELTPAQLAAVVVALELWRDEEAAEQSIGWRLPPILTRWLAVGRSRQLQSWSGHR